MSPVLFTAMLWMSHLSLHDVIDSLPNHPAWISAAAEVEHAEGMQKTAEGAFDLQSSMSGALAPTGKWRKGNAVATIAQAFPVWGRPTVEAGYRYGYDFPDWDGQRTTSSAGEIRAQASIELAKNLWLDAERAAILTSNLGVEQAAAALEETRLKLAEESTKAYWAWVAAAHIARVEQNLLQTAEERQTALERQVQSGAIASILLAENRRLVLSRRAEVVTASQTWIIAAQQLSYFYRDESGRMRPPPTEFLPSLEGEFMQDVTLLEAERLVQSRPEMRVYDALIAQNQIERSLAENQMLPAVTTSVSLSQDLGREIPIGQETTSNNSELYWGIRMSLPVQRRAAQGKSQQAQAKQQIFKQKRQQALDLLLVRVRNAHQSVRAAEQRVSLAFEARQAAEEIERAERRRFEEGQSDLLAVNLREQATASEARKWVQARAKLAEARMLYRLAVGVWTVQ